MSKRLENMIALVTGASQGIGSEVARVFAREGASIGIVHLPDSEQKARAESVVAEVEGLGSRAIALHADVASYAAMAAAASTLIGAYGKINIVVACAGIPSRTAFSELTEAAWDQVIAVNLKGAFNSIHAALPSMLKQGSGKIITIASQQYITGRGKAAYVASKAGVVGLTKALAHELGPLGVNVNCVAPGPTDTPMLRSAPGIDANYIASLPLRRLGAPKDIAEAVLFLASSEGSYFAGQVLSPNGGIAM